MKIQSSDVLLTSRHLSVQKYSKSESLKVWVGKQRPDFEGRAGRGQTPSRDSVALSDKARSAMQAWLKSIQATSANVAPAQTDSKNKSAEAQIVDMDKAMENDPRSMLIRLMIEALTGKKIHFTSMANISSDAGTQAPPDPNPAPPRSPHTRSH